VAKKKTTSKTAAKKQPIEKKAKPKADKAPPASAETRPITSWFDSRLDFTKPVPLRRSYIIASSYRCGSTFLCSELWKSGLLGAPTEYINIDRGNAAIPSPTEPGRLMVRFGAKTPEDYFVKLLQHRTSRNGIFGMKAHGHHFEAALTWCPSMLKIMAPVTFIYINRRDKVAQAVSMAKAMQTNAWISFDQATGKNMRYDAGFIEQCKNELEQQRLNWWRWFDANGVTPFVVTYEDLLADKDSVVRSVVELLEVQNDAPDAIDLPVVEKQADEINAEWAARFSGDRRAGAAQSWDADGGDIEIASDWPSS
jgi:trehalose 2-sulfotransferase